MINFMFDGGVLSDPGRIRLQVEELDDATFFPWNIAATLLPIFRRTSKLVIFGDKTGKAMI
jgi:hypothetical protein